MIKRIQGVKFPIPTNADEKLAKIIFKACAYSSSDRYLHPSDLRLDLESIANDYIEMQSEVFSENGINYYINDSICSKKSKGFGSVINSSNRSMNDNITSSQNKNDMVEELVFSCPACKNTVKKGDSFCGYCGQKLIIENKQSVVCPCCGFDMKLGVKFCGKCGYKIN